MPFIRHRSPTRADGAQGAAAFEIVEHDGWLRVLDGSPLPGGDVVVALARLELERDALRARAGRLGVRVPPDRAIGALAADLSRLARIELEFPKFADGRAYSQARRLRDEHGYGGDIVAVGDVLRDQLLYMHRCGFSSFELAPGKSAEDALRAFDELAVRYQAAADERLPLWKRVARPPA